MRSFEEEMKELWTYDIVVPVKEDSKVYFSAGWFNGLIEADAETLRTKVISTFPDEEKIVSDLQGETICVGDRIFFCTKSTKSFYYYDFCDEKMKVVKLPDNDDYWLDRDDKFAKIINIEKYIFLLPSNYNQLLCFDMDIEEFIVYSDWFEEYEKLTEYTKTDIKHKPLFVNYIVDNNKYMCKVLDKEEWFYFDLSTCEYKFDRGIEKSIISVEKTNENPHIICDDGSCWSYNFTKGEFELNYNIPYTDTDIMHEFVRLEQMYFFPSKEKNEMYIYDVETGDKRRINIDSCMLKTENTRGYAWKVNFIWIKLIGDDIWLLNKHNEFIRYNIDSGKYEVLRFTLEEAVEGFVYGKNQKKDSARYRFFPHETNNLDALIDSLFDKANLLNGVDVGERIYGTLK